MIKYLIGYLITWIQFKIFFKIKFDLFMTNISILYIESLHINVIYYSVYLNRNYINWSIYTIACLLKQKISYVTVYIYMYCIC
jgi:hypothetical protein